MNKLLVWLMAWVVLSGTAAVSLPGEKPLQDPNPEIRMTAALKQAKAYKVAAFPVLIDLIGVLPAAKRAQVEEFLQEWAGDWAPGGGPAGDDEIARRIRRDAWAGWWANTDGPTLLAMLQKQTLSPAEEKKVLESLGRLGDGAYAVREKAVTDLVARGRPVLAMLRETLKHSKGEVVQRVRRCMERIEAEPAHRLPPAALRLVALRKPPGAAQALLAYLPFAEDDTRDETLSALARVAVQGGKPDPALLRALADPRAALRASAAEILAKAAPDTRPMVRKLLDDADRSVRLRAAMALAPWDSRAVPILIDLLMLVQAEQAWQVHDFLTPLAGERAPPGPEDNADARKKCSAAWAAWWKENGKKAELSRLVAPQRERLGYTVICEWNTGRIYELGRNRKERWSFGGTRNPVDALMLSNNRVLVAEFSANTVTERDLKGTIIWQKQVVGNPQNVQRLPNGHTFIATPQQVVEVDRTGKQVFLLNAAQAVRNFGQFQGAYKTRKGHIVCMTPGGQCLHVDAAGKQLKSFNTNIGGAYMDLLPNGRILISQNGGNRIAEYDPDGKLLLDLNFPSVSGISGLPNGNVLVASNTTGRVAELDRKGKVIWQYQAQGPFRARGR
jgi:hypothetical protein